MAGKLLLPGLEHCHACGLREKCRAPVPGKYQGSPSNVRAVLIGEAPGRD